MKNWAYGHFLLIQAKLRFKFNKKKFITNWFKNIFDTDILCLRTLKMIFKKNITSHNPDRRNVVLRGNDTRNGQKASSVHSCATHLRLF